MDGVKPRKRKLKQLNAKKNIHLQSSKRNKGGVYTEVDPQLRKTKSCNPLSIIMQCTVLM